jgi:hypothetical protein
VTTIPAVRQHSLRDLFNGLRYLIRYGIAWRAMPNDRSALVTFLLPWPDLQFVRQRMDTIYRFMAVALQNTPL